MVESCTCGPFEGEYFPVSVSRRRFNGILATGIASVGASVAAEERPIRVGVSAGLTGPISESIVPYVAGLQLAFNEVNKAGGVGGRQLQLVVNDDQYQPATTIANTEDFLAHKVDVLLGYTGTRTVEKAIDFLQTKPLVLFGPFTGAAQLRHPERTNVIFVTADYLAEVDRLLEHFATVGSTRLAVIYQNDALGKPLAEYVQTASKGRGLSATEVIGVEPGEVVAPEIIARVVASDPHAVLCFTVPGPTIGIVKALRRTYRRNVGLLSFSSNRALIASLGTDAAGVVISQIVPGPYATDHPLIKSFWGSQRDLDRSQVTHSYITGYLISSLLVQTLKASAGKTDPDSMHTAWDTVKARKPFGLTFGARGAQYADITMLRSDGRFVH